MLGIHVAKDEIKSLFATLDADGDGIITFKEFNRLLKRETEAQAREREASESRMSHEWTPASPRVEMVDLGSLRKQLKVPPLTLTLTLQGGHLLVRRRQLDALLPDGGGAHPQPPARLRQAPAQEYAVGRAAESPRSSQGQGRGHAAAVGGAKRRGLLLGRMAHRPGGAADGEPDAPHLLPRRRRG